MKQISDYVAILPPQNEPVVPRGYAVTALCSDAKAMVDGSVEQVVYCTKNNGVSSFKYPSCPS